MNVNDYISCDRELILFLRSKLKEASDEATGL